MFLSTRIQRSRGSMRALARPDTRVCCPKRVTGRRGGWEREVARSWNGATYQNDYLSLPFTLIDKSCYVNECNGRGDRPARVRYTRGPRGGHVRITRKLKILRLCGRYLKGAACNDAIMASPDGGTAGVSSRSSSSFSTLFL